MTAVASKPAADLVRRVLPPVIVIGAIAGVAAVQPRAVAFITHANWRLKAPDFNLLAGQRLEVLLHLASALTALVIGTVILLRPKGRGLHKALGWTWVAAMATTAVSSLFIHSFTGGRFGFIHLLSGWTIIALPMALAAIRRRDVAGHRRAMTSLFTGGLLIAGLLTFIPGRLMWRMFFG